MCRQVPGLQTLEGQVRLAAARGAEAARRRQSRGPDREGGPAAEGLAERPHLADGGLTAGRAVRACMHNAHLLCINAYNTHITDIMVTQ